MASLNAEISTRLRDFGQKNFQSMSKFASALGLTAGALQSYLNGRSKPGSKMQARLRQLGCDIEWLMTGRVPHPAESDLRPVFAEVPAGKGNIIQEAPIRYEYAPPDVNDNGRGYWLKVKGDSMYPALRDGQLVFVNPDREVRDNDFAVVVWDEHEEGAIKQVNFSGEDVILTSLNQQYKPVAIHRRRISMIARICFTKL